MLPLRDKIAADQIMSDARQLAQIVGPDEAARRLGLSREAVQRALDAATPSQAPAQAALDRESRKP